MQSCKLLDYTNVCRGNTELSKLPELAGTQRNLSADQVSHLQGAYWRLVPHWADGWRHQTSYQLCEPSKLISSPLTPSITNV